MANSKADILAWAKRMWGTWGRQLADMMGLTLQEPTFRVVDADDENLNGGVAAADSEGNIIYLSADYFGSNLDVGALVHEGAHMIGDVARDQYSGLSDKQFSKLIEGAADAVRARMGLDDNGTWEPSRFAARLAELSSSQFKQVNQAIQAGTFDRKLLRQVENGTLDIDLSQPTNYVHPVTGGSYYGDSAQGGGDGSLTFDPRDFNFSGSTTDEERNTAAAYRALLSGYGIPLTGNLQTMIDRGVARSWSIDLFMERVRQTPEYRRTFPGIFNPNGTLKMTETQYLDAKQQFIGIASQSGVNLGPKKMAWLFQHDVTPEEFADRSTALGRIKRNPELYAAYRRELVQSGAAKPGDVTKKALFKQVLGMGNQKWTDVWNDAIVRYTGTQAGLTFRKAADKAYTKLGQGVIERISGLGLSEQELSAGFLNLEETLRTALPLAEANLYGLRKKDVVAATFGGKGAGRAREKLERVLMTAQAAEEEERVTTSAGLTDTGGARTAGGGQAYRPTS